MLLLLRCLRGGGGELKRSREPKLRRGCAPSRGLNLGGGGGGCSRENTARHKAAGAEAEAEAEAGAAIEQPAAEAAVALWLRVLVCAVASTVVAN